MVIVAHGRPVANEKNAGYQKADDE